MALPQMYTPISRFELNLTRAAAAPLAVCLGLVIVLTAIDTGAPLTGPGWTLVYLFFGLATYITLRTRRFYAQLFGLLALMMGNRAPNPKPL